MSAFDVVVLGGVALDWVARVPELPPVDGLVIASAFDRYPGGSAANMAVGLARLGRRVLFCGKLGDDEAGQVLLKAFHDEGVDTGGVLIERGRPSAACFIGVDERGQRAIYALPGASQIEDPAELDPSAWRGARALLIGPAYPSVALAAVRAARAAGCTVLMAPGGGWDPTGLALLRPALGLVQVLLLSEGDARGLTGLELEPALERLGELGPAVMVVTRGARGSVLLEAGGRREIPAIPVRQVRDSTGAGDAFAAGLVAAHLQGQSWPEAVAYGSAAAALKLQHPGARGGLPTRAAVEAALRAGPARS